MIYIYIYIMLYDCIMCIIKLFTLLDLCVSSLRRGHANLLCIVPILTDDPRRESYCIMCIICKVQPASRRAGGAPGLSPLALSRR